MRKLLLALCLCVGMVGVGEAQITVPNTLVDGTTIVAADLNTNFTTIANHALDRITGGNLTGNVTADALITFDGVDVGVQACVSCTPTFAKVTTSNTSATSLTVGGGITAGTGAVALVSAAGQIPAISSTYFASLSGTNLTGVALTGGANVFTSTNSFSGVSTFTGRNDFQGYTETFTQPAISGGVLTTSLSTGSHFLVTFDADVSTLTISNATASKAQSFVLALVANGTPHTVSWPASVKWAGGVAPTLTSTNGKVDFFTFLTYSQGTIWYGFVGGQSF